ncbi:MAG: asparagine synthase (glutamine-hydrolyzing), partial [Nitrospiraceae bacterium]|nr:asparagine synthase (glutamine-hydrolyzing) [Nitrospiraceae bacterium]
NKTLLLARDRIGKKPFYYYMDKYRLLFASELKALLCDPNLPKEIDCQALDCYLSYGYVPSPFSIIKGVKKLPPAHIGICKNRDLVLRPYWRLKLKNKYSDIKVEEAVEQLKSIFDRAVKKRLVSDVPLGAFLSGGVDSSAVVAAMARIKGSEPVRTTTIGFSDKRYDEMEFARLVARAYKTDHEEYVVQPNVLEIIDKIVWYLDEPFADSSAIPTYYVSKMTRQRVTVALSGDGGDENFAGYVQRYRGIYREQQVRNGIPQNLRKRLLGPISRIYPKWDFLPRPLRLKNFLMAISSSFEDAYVRTMSFYFTPEMKKRLYRDEFFQRTEGFDASEVLLPHLRQVQGLDPVSRAQYTDIMTYLPEDILVKVDRMSMANSLEVRSPILDHRLMEFVARLPWWLKLRGTESKYIFKKMNEKKLPNEILYRKKQGFCVPLAPWLRNDIRDFARDILFAPNSILRDHFDITYVKDLWKRHQQGWQDCSAPLWGLIMLELWHRRVVDSGE